jgi:hypothetical protein
LLIYDKDEKIYRMTFRIFWSIAMYIEPDGKITKQANTSTDDDKFNFFFNYYNGYWKIAGSGVSSNFKEAQKENDE